MRLVSFTKQKQFFSHYKRKPDYRDLINEEKQNYNLCAITNVLANSSHSSFHTMCIENFYLTCEHHMYINWYCVKNQLKYNKPLTHTSPLYCYLCRRLIVSALKISNYYSLYIYQINKLYLL